MIKPSSTGSCELCLSRIMQMQQMLLGAMGAWANRCIWIASDYLSTSGAEDVQKYNDMEQCCKHVKSLDAAIS